MWSWAGFASFSFLICKMGTIIAPIVVRTYRDSTKLCKLEECLVHHMHLINVSFFIISTDPLLASFLASVPNTPLILLLPRQLVITSLLPKLMDTLLSSLSGSFSGDSFLLEGLSSPGHNRHIPLLSGGFCSFFCLIPVLYPPSCCMTPMRNSQVFSSPCPL